MRYHPKRPDRGSGQKIAKPASRKDLHQPVPPTLLGCFHNVPAQSIRRRPTWLGHAAEGGQRDEGRRPQLDEFFHQESLPLSFGQGDSQHQANGQFAIDGPAGNDLHSHFAAARFGNQPFEFVAASVEQGDRIARPASQDVKHVVGLIPLEEGRVRGNGLGDKKAADQPDFLELKDRIYRRTRR